MQPVHRFKFVVPSDALDENGHVNNVVYVQWMQDVAIQHSQATSCMELTRAAGATWVARMHQIEYLRPAFAGDVIEIVTWIADLRKVRSLRRYKFIRTTDAAVLARGETDWVYVDATTGRPRAIPETIRNAFGVADTEPD